MVKQRDDRASVRHVLFSKQSKIKLTQTRSSALHFEARDARSVLGWLHQQTIGREWMKSIRDGPRMLRQNFGQTLVVGAKNDRAKGLRSKLPEFRADGRQVREIIQVLLVDVKNNGCI